MTKVTVSWKAFCAHVYFELLCDLNTLSCDRISDIDAALRESNDVCVE